MADIQLMVLPNVVAEESVRLQLFVEHAGVWSDVSLTTPVNVAQIRTAVDQALRENVMRVIEQDPTRDVQMTLRQIGAINLYQKLVPEELQHILREAVIDNEQGSVPVLLIHTLMDWIPWEIMFDVAGGYFLGSKFQIVRLPILTNTPNLDGVAARPLRQIYNVLGNHLFSQDPALFDIWKGTFSTLNGVAAVERPFPSEGSNWTNFPRLEDVADFPNELDILHFTCHGGLSDETGQQWWTLDHQTDQPDEYRISMDNLGFLSQLWGLANKRPLIFGNACASAQAGNNSNGELLLGFGAKFFELGAATFIGTFAPVSQAIAVKFAREFYQHLLGHGLPVAEALWQTKQHFAQEDNNDPSWMFYCLYGSPDTRFELMNNH